MRAHKIDLIYLAAFIVTTIATIVLVGWTFDLETAKSVYPGYITMKANTALLFVAMAAALLFAKRSTGHSRLTFVLSLFTIALASLTLAEYLFKVDFGIDQLLVHDFAAGRRFPPGRLAPITALNFIFLATSFIADRFRTKAAGVYSQLAAAIVLFAAFQAVIGYIIGLTYMFGSAFYTQMALHTAICFVVLAVAKLLFQSERGLMKSFIGHTPTAKLTRWMILAAAFVPPLMRWLAQAGYGAGVYDADFAQLIQVVGITALMSLIVASAGAALFRTESDILDRQQALSDSEQNFRALVETAAQIVWRSDSDGTIHEDSPSWRAYTGQTIDQWKDNGWLTSIHPDDRALVSKTWQEAILKQRPYEVECRLRHLDGEWRWSLARGTPLFDENNQVRSWIGMISDIHERKSIFLDLQEAKEEAERANRLKSAFLANMSHEIRTPLGAMIGFAELSNDDHIERPEQKEFLDIVERNGQQLKLLIEDILDLSKVEAGVLTLELAHADPRELVTDVINTLRFKARDRGVDFKTNFDGSFPATINTDPARLKQVLLNIIGNAVKFTEQGHIHITGRLDTSGATPRLELRVCDTGIGVPEAQRDSIFDRFVQADNSLTRKFGGTGLGLTLSRRLARLLGGDVTLMTSREGEGSDFRVTIATHPETAAPAVNAATASDVGAKAATRSLLNNLNLLVVDDSTDNLQLIKRSLEKRGASVDCAENGLIGANRALATHYDLIIMDLQMPVMDGFTAIQKLRSEGCRSPVIALSAHAMNEVRVKCLELGCVEQLSKPINFEDLSREIHKYARQPQP